MSDTIQTGLAGKDTTLASLVARELNPYYDDVMIKESLELTRHLSESRAFKKQILERMYVIGVKPFVRGCLLGTIAGAVYGVAHSISPENKPFLDMVMDAGAYGALIDAGQTWLRYGVRNLARKE